MAKIKIRFDVNEIEIDSRDFYLDNQTVGSVIENLTKHIHENVANVSYMNKAETDTRSDPEQGQPKSVDGLDSLEEAEVFEPEFNEPQPIEYNQIQAKLKILDTDRFFDLPRTVTETVQRLRDHGWLASSLDVSKALAKMACGKEILKNFEDDRTYYTTRNPLLAA